jgi:hypothetical protein
LISFPPPARSLRISRPRAQERTREIGGEHSIPFGEREFLRLFDNADPGIVDENVEPPEGLDGSGDPRAA